MRIEALTDRSARKFLSGRSRSDSQAEQVAAKIIADVRKRGDAALFAWAQKLDRTQLNRKTLWFDGKARRAALQQISPALRSAIEHAARNIRRVAEQKKPRAWTITVGAGGGV